MAAHILFVTGKGGTGKSAVARGLAEAAAAAGRPVALVRMRPAGESEEAGASGAKTSGRRPGTPDGPSSRGGQPISSAPKPTRVREVLLDDRGDLEAFLTRVLRLGFLARRLLDSRTFSAVAAAAPGLRDLVTLTAITTLAASRPLGRRGLVVVDAPATGHSVPLLTAPGRVLELAPVGPVASEARAAHRVVIDPAAFTPLLVTTPEELAISEVLSLHDQLREAGVPFPRIVVNGLWPAHVAANDAAKLEASGASADALLHLQRRRRQDELVAQLEARVGECPKVDFSFVDGSEDDGALSSTDAHGLYEQVVG